MKPDPIIDRSSAQKRLRIEQLRQELKPLGYSIVNTERLKTMMAKVPLMDRIKTMMVDE